MEYQNLIVEERDQILYLTINRPEALNALNQQTMQELAYCFGTAYVHRQDLHGVILLGGGDKAFVAGADIKEFIALSAELGGTEVARRGQEVLFLLERFHRPVVAVVHGFALGGGCELAMACHLRVATATARFGQPEVNLGILPGYGGTQRLPQLVGKARAIELILTAEQITAEQALHYGLVNAVAPSLAEALALATALLQK